MDELTRQIYGETAADRLTGWILGYVFVVVTLPGVAVLAGWSFRVLRWAAGL